MSDLDRAFAPMRCPGEGKRSRTEGPQGSGPSDDVSETGRILHAAGSVEPSWNFYANAALMPALSVNSWNLVTLPSCSVNTITKSDSKVLDVGLDTAR